MFTIDAVRRNVLTTNPLASHAWGESYLILCVVALSISISCYRGGDDRGMRAAEHVRAVAEVTGVGKDRLANPVSHSPTLDIGNVLRHGDIVEIEGSADPGDTVMINGEPAATFFDGSGFRHFVGPLPRGLNIISITVQDEHGGVTTRQLAITTE